jgi:hypothetical protein
MTTHFHAVTLAAQHMEQPTKDALKQLKDAVELWGATAYHHHVVDVRQQVETDLTAALDDLLRHVDQSTTLLGTLLPYLMGEPVNEVVAQIDREVKALRAAYVAAADQRRHVRAEGLDQTAEDIAEHGPRSAAT